MLRWFTPTSEIYLCGHATFGTAFALLRFYEPKKLTSDLSPCLPSPVTI
ncbi:MAG: PhzF family phenazine biosynthesis protein [Atopobiaceae bacterium]|nr:PhzF family phenazine biosynthesis protein [Atopobiaceae bacterium]